jgi:hypothetical protein
MNVKNIYILDWNVDTELVSGTLFLTIRAFIQVAIHAIGDKANDMVLDMYRSVVSVNGIRDRRFRVLYQNLCTHSYKK